MTGSYDYLRQGIRTVPDFPEPGVQFRDIAPLLADPAMRRTAVRMMARQVDAMTVARRLPDKVVAVEARGFILGSMLAEELGVGLAMARKAGKLPRVSASADYDLEYGESTLEMDDTVREGDRVLVVDDVLATGGTLAAAREMVESLGAEVVAFSVLISLRGLGGASRLQPTKTVSLLRY